MGLFNRKQPASDGPAIEEAPRHKNQENHENLDGSTGSEHEKSAKQHTSHLPQYNHNGHLITKHVKPEGESGRKWVHPWMFLRICFRSTSTASKVVNVLWPFVPAAIAIHFARPDLPIWIFALNYIAMVPTANLIGFAGQELARKLPKVFGIVLETTIGSLVEIVLFMVLITTSTEEHNLIPVIQAAILGSILTNLLLCLGMCFFVGGMRRGEQEFHEVISETGTGLLLVAGFGLLIPSAFYTALSGSTNEHFTVQELSDRVRTISRSTAIVLLAAFLIFLWFNLRSHHSIYDEVLEMDEEKDADRHKDLKKDKLTFTECLLALALALTCVCLHAVFLVQTIEAVVERGVSDQFLGLILVPLVEKAAEHLTAVDEAWDNQMNFALFHCLGPSIQTALLNAPLVVIVGWCLDKNMDLNFEIFMIVLLIMAILVVGNFLRDGKSNYLEGALCVLVYIIIAVCTWYYPNPRDASSNSNIANETGGNANATATPIAGGASATAEATAEAAKLLVRMMMN